MWLDTVATVRNIVGAAVLLTVILLAVRALCWILVASIVISWPLLTLYVAQLDTNPPGFDDWIGFLVVTVAVFLAGATLWLWRHRKYAGRKQEPCGRTEVARSRNGTGPSICLHLVPGTWARGYFAPWFPGRPGRKPFWFEDGSEFRSGLSNVLGGAGNVDFSSLGWTERNGLRARSAAADDFAGCLKGELERNPDADHYIVAHSHGGNIALCALRQLQPGELGRIRGLVTMGTPFLWFETLDLGPAAKAIEFLARWTVPAITALGTVVAAFFLLLFPLIRFHELPGWLNSWPFYVVGIGSVILLGFREYEKTDQTLELALESRPLQNQDDLPPMLVLRSPDDEASRGMRGGQTTARLLMVVWTLFDALFKRGKVWWRVTLLIAGSFLVGVLSKAGWPDATMANVISAFKDPINVFFEGFTSLYIGGTMGAIVFSGFAAVPLAIALGPELLRLPLLVKPVVEDLPTSVRVLAANLPGDGFRHQVYGRPEAAKRVAEFVNELSTTRRSSTGAAAC